MRGVTAMGSSIWLLLVLVTFVSASLPSSASFNDVWDQRQRRSLASVPIIGSLFGGQKELEIPHLGNQPLWKVHRYNGITLIPIDLPEDEALAAHPVPPFHSEEAPSIVNVPDPFYAPKDTVPLPHNEYGPPEHSSSGPYPTAGSSSGPYPSAGPSSGPYPPDSPSSGPYPPANSHSGPYPPSNPHDEHAEPADYGSHHGDLESVLGGLSQILPADVYQRLQSYMSTPEGYERINALVGIAANAKKLKSGAAHSLQEVFQRFFGGAGGSTNIALHSGTYTNIPKTYPAHQGILNSFGAIGTGVSGTSVLPHLPEVPPLPNVPGLVHLPPTPDLPHINLPASGHFASKGTGQYVSISLPSPPVEPPAPSYEPSAQSYGAPTQSYSSAAAAYSPPTQPYSAPTQSYSPPDSTYSAPAQTYSAPQIPSTSYGTPSGPTYPYQSPFQPSQQAHGFDHTVAASETEEQFQPRHKGQEEENEKEEDTEKSTATPVKTTMLHRVNHFRSDNLKKLIESNHRSFRPSQRVQPKDQTQEQNEENVLPQENAE